MTRDAFYVTENVVEGLRHTSPHTHAHDRSVVGPNPGAGEGRWRLRTATTSEGGHPANAQEPTQNHNATKTMGEQQKTHRKKTKT